MANGYLEKKRQEKAIRSSAMSFSRAKTLDGAVLALGQIGCDADFLHKFMKEYLQVEHDILNDIMRPDYEAIKTNSRKDKTAEKLNFAHTKKTIDDLILQYIHQEDYLPFDYRYELKEIPQELRRDDL